MEKGVGQVVLGKRELIHVQVDTLARKLEKHGRRAYLK
jgi:hypothetical protein